MTKLLARWRQSRSFIAGLVMGLAIVIAVFGAMEADSSAWQTPLTFGAPLLLALGLALQILATAQPSRPPATHAECEFFVRRLAMLSDRADPASDAAPVPGVVPGVRTERTAELVC